MRNTQEQKVKRERKKAASKKDEGEGDQLFIYLFIWPLGWWK